MEKKLKVLVVDDAVTYRQILTKILSVFEKVELVGIAPNGKIALTKIPQKQPDLILLDLFMPEMDGLETLKQIKKAHPHIDVIMISGVDQETANITLKALESGALDFIPKSQSTSAEENIALMKSTLFRLIQMALTRKYSRQAREYTLTSVTETNTESSFDKTASHSLKKTISTPSEETIFHTSPERESIWKSAKNEEFSIKRETKIRNNLIILPTKSSDFKLSDKKVPITGEPVSPPKKHKIEVVAIGVSTGGPNALQEIVPKLNADFPVPILVVQHMPATFTASLAERLDNLSAIKVVEGKENQKVEKGVMYIAPGGRHMIVRKDKFNHITLGIIDSPPVNSCRPSVDVLFRSIGMTYGGCVLTVILTGMGNDGVAGVTAIRRKGGYSIVQDDKTSLIWGMPGAVVSASQADEIIPIDNIAFRIIRIVKKGRLNVED